jgi:hypothetical protein
MATTNGTTNRAVSEPAPADRLAAVEAELAAAWATVNAASAEIKAAAAERHDLQFEPAPPTRGAVTPSPKKRHIPDTDRPALAAKLRDLDARIRDANTRQHTARRRCDELHPERIALRRMVEDLAGAGDLDALTAAAASAEAEHRELLTEAQRLDGLRQAAITAAHLDEVVTLAPACRHATARASLARGASLDAQHALASAKLAALATAAHAAEDAVRTAEDDVVRTERARADALAHARTIAANRHTTRRHIELIERQQADHAATVTRALEAV